MVKEKKKKPSIEKVEQYNAVLLEDIRSKMELVIEVVDSTKTELKGEMRSFKENVNDRFDVLETVVKKNSSNIVGLKTGMKDMEKRLSTKIDGIRYRVDDHEERITTLETDRL